MASRTLNGRAGELRIRVERMPASRRAAIVFGVLLVLAGVFLYHETRGTTLWFDDWDWALYRRGSSAATFLDPHNQHLCLIPIAIYKLLFATAGLDSYGPFRVIVTLCHLGVSLLVFVYATRRVGSFFGLLAGATILLLGPGWQNILWPFQIGWLLSLGCGLGALLMLDRGDRTGDVGACVLLAVSLASSGLGLAIGLGIAVEVLAGPERRRRWWIVVAPFALYAVWWLAYQDSHLIKHNIVLTPAFALKAMASSVSAIFGLAGSTLPGDQSSPLTFGPALLVAAVALTVWRLARSGRPALRLWGLATMAGAFWILTGLTRASLSTGYDSRYLYAGALFVLLLAVEVARGIQAPRAAQLVLGVVVLGALVSNVGALRDGARFLRLQAPAASADLGALDIGRPLVGSRYAALSFPGSPFITVLAGPYYSAEKAFGTPAYTQAELSSAAEPDRERADAELTRMHRVGLQRAPAVSSPGPAPRVDSSSGGTLVTSGGCQTLRPTRFGPASSRPALELTLPRSGLILKATGGSDGVSVRRFGAQFPSETLNDLSGAALLRIGPDRSPAPWHVRLQGSATVSACGLS